MNYSAYSFLDARRDASPHDIMNRCQEYISKWTLTSVRERLKHVVPGEHMAMVAAKVHHEGNVYIRSMASVLLDPSARQCYDAWLDVQESSSPEKLALTKARMSWFNQTQNKLMFGPDMMSLMSQSGPVKLASPKPKQQHCEPKCRECRKAFDLKKSYLVLHCHCTTRVGHESCMRQFKIKCTNGKCPVCRQCLLERRQVSKYLFWNVKQKYKFIA